MLWLLLNPIFFPAEKSVYFQPQQPGLSFVSWGLGSDSDSKAHHHPHDHHTSNTGRVCLSLVCALRRRNSFENSLNSAAACAKLFSWRPISKIHLSRSLCLLCSSGPSKHTAIVPLLCVFNVLGKIYTPRQDQEP